MEPKKYLTAEEILATDDLVIKELNIPEWGGIVRFRTMSGGESLQFQEENKEDKTTSWIRIFSKCAVDENGQRLFTDKQMDALLKKSTKVFLTVQTFLIKLNGMGKDNVAPEAVKV